MADPGSEDFNKISQVFDKAIGELKTAGAEIIDPVVIPNLKNLLAKRAGSFADEEQSFKNFHEPEQKIRRISRNKMPCARRSLTKSSSTRVSGGSERRARTPITSISRAREELMTHLPEGHGGP
jgi:Asp-tRNA(Asn)/Glu-tRNA(Gln) amidotransferase A subunit family amidase